MFSAEYILHIKWNKLQYLIIYTLAFPSQTGFVNSLKFSSSGQFLVAGVGQEHRYL